MHNTRSLTACGTVLLSLLAGCGGGAATPSENSPEVATTANAIEQSNGGLTTTNEQVNFADPAYMSTVPALTESSIDALVADDGATMTDPIPAPMRTVYRVVMLWGHLPQPSDADTTAAPRATAVTNWTGAVSIQNGAISVRRTLGFEQGDAVRARTDPSRVDFVSHTLPFADGLALTVVARTPTASLHFETAAYTGDLPLPDADGEARYLGDGHNGVYYVAYAERPGCRQGFVFGHWLRLRANLGFFRGRALESNGAQAGVLRGVFGRTRAGQNVFFGKHISNMGVFNGLFGGAFGAGHFEGAWGTRDGSRGELRGRYFDGTIRGDGHGAFLGRWREACP